MPKNVIEQIYDKLADVLGGTNPNQVFTMVMPGTTLNPQTYAYDTQQMKPATVLEAESRIADQMFDIAKVTGGSNGQRVSAQYLQALSVLVPRFEGQMPMLKKTLRDFLNQPMPANTLYNGQPFTGTLQEYYFRLYDDYLQVKLNWETQVQAKKDELALNPATENELFLEWYEDLAEIQLAKIDEAYGKVLAVFSPADMDAILGALSAGPEGEIDEAENMVRDMRMASPNGGYFYPVEFTPNDWFLDLASDLEPANLLQDPEFIANTLNAKRQALMGSISQVQAMLNNMPLQGDLKAAASTLQNAQKTYTDAQNNLANAYAQNALTAVEMYLTAGGSEALSVAGDDLAKAKRTVDDNAVKASAAKGEKPQAMGATKSDGKTPLSKEDLQGLLDGFNKVQSAQSNLLSSVQGLSNAGLNLASTQAAYFGDLPILLSRLQAQLSELDNLKDNLAASIAVGASRSIPQLRPASTLSTSDTNTLNQALQAAQGAAAANNSTGDSVVAALNNVIKNTTSLNTVTTAATTTAAAGPSIALVLKKVQDAIDDLSSVDDVNLGKTIKQAMTTAAAAPAATSATIITAVNEVNKDVTAGDNTPGVNHIETIRAACTTLSTQKASASDVLDAITTAANDLLRQPVVKKSDTSQRFMELQLSFTADEMDTSSYSDSSYSQSGWSVNLFFGSASGSSSSSSAINTKNSLEQSTEIQIGLKAAKVDINRGWLDPGVFKITDDMNRIASQPISQTSKAFNNNNGSQSFNWSQAQQLNDCILPSFPTAFVVVKDVSITFKASESSLQAVQTVLDSRKAAGGGFLCFSASGSSASHTDNSSLQTRSNGAVININMPGPQILGYFLELTPDDRSTDLSVVLNSTTANGTATGTHTSLNIIEFVKQLKALQTDGNQPTHITLPQRLPATDSSGKTLAQPIVGTNM